MSTFHGLEMAKQTLAAQRSALYTTGNNIANVNTAGYSRQRVDFQTRSPLHVQGAGQVGTGVDIGTIGRIRDSFLDMQYRMENSRLGYWETRQNELHQMEVLLNEPSEAGLAHSMDQFWQALQSLENESDLAGVRAIVAQKALAFTDTLNHLSNGIQGMQKDVGEKITDSVTTINQIVKRIEGLNQEIQKIEQRGLLANDLYDERDRLVDDLSKFMNIKVHRVGSSDRAPANAEGLYEIEVVDETGNRIDEGIFLLQDESFELTLAKGQTGEITSLEVGGQAIGLGSEGKLTALIKVYGYEEDGQMKGEHVEFLDQLNAIANQFATAFNDVHNTDENGLAFFDGGPNFTAGNITVNSEILENPDKIVAGQKISDVFEATSIRENYISLIGKLGASTEAANQMKLQTETVHGHIAQTRMATSAVSLDEEIANMIKFQHAYNAAARNMTVIDELLDVVINRMGVVGR